MADLIVGIYGGVDTHKDLHVAAVVDQTGRVLGTESFAANPAGYRRLESWICAFGPVVKAGVEGTSSYGVELRRTEPKIVVPTRALLYATTPVRALLGTCVITSVESANLAVLWREYGSRTALLYQEFQQYFEGVAVGTALTLTDPRQFSRIVPLQDLRAKPRSFRPPQSFAYVDTKTGDRLLRMAA